jgi:hypothetical protein
MKRLNYSAALSQLSRLFLICLLLSASLATWAADKSVYPDQGPQVVPGITTWELRVKGISGHALIAGWDASLATPEQYRGIISSAMFLLSFDVTPAEGAILLAASSSITLPDLGEDPKAGLAACYCSATVSKVGISTDPSAPVLRVSGKGRCLDGVLCDVKGIPVQ